MCIYKFILRLGYYSFVFSLTGVNQDELIMQQQRRIEKEVTNVSYLLYILLCDYIAFTIIIHFIKKQCGKEKYKSADIMKTGIKIEDSS